MERRRNQGLTTDTLFVGLTRPPMLFGVTYSAMIVNAVVTMETFIVTRDLLWLLAFIPVHGLLCLVCLYEPRFFDLIQLWGRTRGLALLGGNVRFWLANSHSPLVVDLPNAQGARTAAPSRIVV